MKMKQKSLPPAPPQPPAGGFGWDDDGFAGCVGDGTPRINCGIVVSGIAGCGSPVCDTHASWHDFCVNDSRGDGCCAVKVRLAKYRSRKAAFGDEGT